MIEKAYETLEREKEIAITRVHSMNGNISMDEYLKKEGLRSLIGRPIHQEKLKKAALEEVEINYLSVENYLKRLESKHLEINDDLTEIPELYSGNAHYRILMNHIDNHFAKLKNIPARLEAKECYPNLCKTKIKSISDLMVGAE